MKVAVPCAAALALFPLVSAFPAPTAAHGEPDIIKYGLVVREARGLQPRQSGRVTPSPSSAAEAPPSTAAPPQTTAAPTQQEPTTTSSSRETSSPPSSSEQPTRTTPTSSPTSATPATPTSRTTSTSVAPTPVTRTSTSQTKIESTRPNGEVFTVTSEIVVSSVETPSASPPSPSASQESSGGGVSTSTIVGLSVAGGLAALGALAFIAWKLTRKRFSQFDTNDGAINWPDLQKDPEVAPPRTALSAGAVSTTNSSVDLGSDPYAVPPLPPNTNNSGLGPYRDDPSGFYDPYRGPIPQTFATPPMSTEAHQQRWAVGEAIPLSTYTSGRSSPGPNLAYGGGVDPMQRTGTPVQRMATPVQRVATPVGGATFQDIVRAGTPGGGAVPYRTGTPGYGYGGR